MPLMVYIDINYQTLFSDIVQIVMTPLCESDFSLDKYHIFRF